MGMSLATAAIVSGVIIVTANVLPNGRPCFLNLYRMGRVCIVFDSNNREVLLVATHLSGLVKPKSTVICSYSQFRGIAVHHKSGQVLFLSKREESLLLDRVGDVVPGGNIQQVLEEMSLLWFATEGDGFFGITYRDFSKGLQADNNVDINIDYDFYLKRSGSWKPKNDPLEDGKRRHANRIPDAEDFASERLGPKIADARMASADVGDDEIRDYV